MVVLWLVGQVSFLLGDPSKAFFGTDHLGRRCGIGELVDVPKVYYPRLSQDLLQQQDKVATPWELELYGVCVPACPTEGPDGPRPETVADTLVRGSKQWTVGEGTIDLLNRCVPMETTRTESAHYCELPSCRDAHETCAKVPGNPDLWVVHDGNRKSGKCLREVSRTVTTSTSVPNSDSLLSALGRITGVASAAFTEIFAARDEVLLCGVLLSVIGAVVWLLFLRLFARLAVWTLLYLTAIILLFSTFACALRGGLLPSSLVHDLAAGASNGLTAVRGYANSQGIAISEGSELDASLDRATAALAESETFVITTVATAESEGEMQLSKWAAIILGTLTALYVCLICCLRGAIVKVVAVVTEATKVLAAQPSMILLPFASLTLSLVFLGYFLAILVNLSTAEPTPRLVAHAVRLATTDAKAFAAIAYSTLNDQTAKALEGLEGTGVDLDPRAADALEKLGRLDPSALDADALLVPVLSLWTPSQLRIGLIGYTIFAALWGLNFIHFFAWTGLAGATTHWFFFRNDPAERPCCGIPLLGALWKAFRYHFGSIALGSLVVALVQAVRFLFEYLDAQSKRIREGSQLATLIVNCLRCCLWCFEALLKFVTSYAFIFVALNGDSFCVACKDTYGLLTSYPASAVLMTLVQGLLFIVQSILLPLLCALAGYRLVELRLVPLWLVAAREAADAAASQAAEAVAGLHERAEGLHPSLSSPAQALLGGLAATIEGLMPAVLSEGVQEGAPTPAGEVDAAADVAPLWPAIGIFLIAFLVSRSFAAVYECSASAVFVCAMRDESEYGAKYMSSGLRHALGLAPGSGGLFEAGTNLLEKLTGWDIDGDGDVGEAGAPAAGKRKDAKETKDKGAEPLV